MEPTTTQPTIEAADVVGKIQGGLEALDALAAAVSTVVQDALDRTGRVVELLDEARANRAGTDAGA